jgi:hypothetical protein
MKVTAAKSKLTSVAKVELTVASRIGQQRLPLLQPGNKRAVTLKASAQPRGPEPCTTPVC